MDWIITVRGRVMYVACFVLSVLVIKFCVKFFRLPPGTSSLFRVPEHLYEYYRSVCQRNNTSGVSSLIIGTRLVILISDYKVIRNCFRQIQFTARPKCQFLSFLGGYGKVYLYFHIKIVLLINFMQQVSLTLMANCGANNGSFSPQSLNKWG